jgi:glycosyltransferase involved in cell wall biosynthesis
MTPKTDRPLVTFVVFSFNQEDYIREAIRGAFSQTYSPLEIVLSDDCSSDRTHDIMLEEAAAYDGPHDVRVRQSVTNRGLADHINDIIDASNGDIVSWIAGDDIADARRTEVFVERLLSDPSLSAVHSNITEIDLEGRMLGMRTRTKDMSRLNLADVVATGQSVITQSHAFWRSVFTHFGPFRADLTHEGKAMAFREAALGGIGFVEESLTSYRVGSGISTYSGRDLAKRKHREPIKYTNWHLSAFRQMREDAKRLNPALSVELEETLHRNIRFYENLLRINEGTSLVSPVLRNLLASPRDTKSVRAALRQVLPDPIYARMLR